AVTGNVQYVVDATHDPEVTFGVALGAIAGQVVALELRREVAFLEALGIAPDGTDHGWPRALDDQEATLACRNLLAGFVDHGGVDPGQRQGAGARLEGRGTRQRRNHVHARLSLPPGVDDGAAFAADVGVIPDPRLRIDGFTHRSDDPQAGQIELFRVMFVVGLGRLDERADGRWRRVENGALVALNHFPEAGRRRIGRHAFKHDLGSAGRQRPVSDVSVAGDPAHC